MVKVQEIILTLILWVLAGPIYLLCFVPIYFLFYCYHFIVTKVIRFKNHGNPMMPVSGLDFGFSTDNFWTSPRGSIAFVYKVNGTLCLDSIKERLEFQLNKNCYNDKLKSVYPEHLAGYPFWTRTKEPFKLDNHLRLMDSESSNVNLKLSKWLNSPFHQGSPLWDILVLRLPQNCCCSMFGFRIHHILGDGISMQQFLEDLLDNDKAKEQKESNKLRPKYTRGTFYKYFWAPLTLSSFTQQYFCHQDYFTKRKLSSSSSDFNLSFGTISLLDLKQVRSQLSSKLSESASKKKSVNFTTLLLFVLSSSLRKFLMDDIKIDQRALPGHVNVVLPLPVPNESHPVRTFCNFWTHGVFKVPVAEPNKYTRLLKLYSKSKNLEQRRSNEVLSTFTKLYDVFPKSIFSRLTEIQMGTPIGLTNLTGGKDAEFICGSEILEKYAVLGLQWKEASFTIGSLSYKDKLTITILSNQSSVPNERLNEVLIQYFQDEVKDLMAELDLGDIV